MKIYSIIYFLVSLFLLFVFARFRGKTSIGTMVLAFILGIILAPVAGIISLFLKNQFIAHPNKGLGFAFNQFLLYFFIIGPVEESAKFLAAFASLRNKKDFQNSSDGLVIGICASLGFAGLENILYLNVYGLYTTLPRLILGNLGHAAFSIFWGYALGVVLNENAPRSLIGYSLILSAFLHGLYNFLLTFSLFGAILSFFISLCLYIFMFLFLQMEKIRNRP